MHEQNPETSLKEPHLKIMMAVFQLDRRGGKERDCLAIGRFLVSSGHEVIIVTTSSAAASSWDFGMITLPRSGLTNHARARAFARAVSDVRSANKADTLIAFEKLPGADFYYAADTAIASRSLDFRSWLPRRHRMLEAERGVFGKLARSRVFFLTARQRDEYTALYDFDPMRSIMLPLVLHDDRYEAAFRQTDRLQVRRELGLPTDRIIAVSVAVRPKQKGVDRTLVAIAAHPKLHLVIVGSSDNWLKRQVRALKLQDRVHIVPYVSDVINLMLSADFMVHPARIEAAGQVIGEALLAGCPAIVSGNCGYSSEVHRSGAGIVLPEPFNHAGLIDAISRMIKDLHSLRRAAAVESWRLRTQRGLWLSTIAEQVEIYQRAAAGTQRLSAGHGGRNSAESLLMEVEFSRW
jgi:UDP-glucose:(heptosyl)LPS alpha-1,3-glucosyltransferase